MLEMANTLLSIRQNNVIGDYVEAGVALGGSALMIAKVKPPSAKLYLYDTYAMIPPPSEQDGGDVHQRYNEIIRGNAQGIAGQEYYGYEKDLLSKVKSTFSELGFDPQTQNIFFVKGLFSESMKIDQPVAFAHIDCDWYESVLFCLEQIAPNLSVSGTIVIDDYYDWSGCRKAVDEFLASDKNTHNLDIVHKHKLHLVRMS